MTFLKIYMAVMTKCYYTFLQMSSRKTATRRGTTKKRAQRATSNVFAMFNQDQIAEFKEAFNMVLTGNIINQSPSLLVMWITFC